MLCYVALYDGYLLVIIAMACDQTQSHITMACVALEITVETRTVRDGYINGVNGGQGQHEVTNVLQNRGGQMGVHFQLGTITESTSRSNLMIRTDQTTASLE